MGVVYLARDTRLDRLVAIKALPDHLVDDADRLARFQREAKTLASLNHPNIASIYGLEAHEKHQYLVLEYVGGETLAEVLKRGPIPVDDALVIAKQIAEALEAAHEKGVVHRDIKPGNVIITPDGGAKVLDFGLARTAEGSPSSTSAGVNTDSPTLTTPPPHHHPVHSPTIPGAIMGTAGYMSPEQARGKPVDKRSDIFSFGCVVFEMLSGARPFTGETVADALGATLHKELDLALLPPGTPARIGEMLTNCLAKDRRNRLHDIGDARIEIERALAGREWASAPTTAEPRRGARMGAWGIACAAAMLALGWALSSALTDRPTDAPAHPFYVSTAIPGSPRFNGFAGISPDARFLVYAAWPEQDLESVRPQGVLVVRRLDRDETTVIEGTEGARNAALSPDGRWVAFSCAKDRAGTRFCIKKIALENGRPTGRPETVCDLEQGTWFNLGWASDREIVFSASLDRAVYAVSAFGGEPRVVLRNEDSDGLQGWDNLRPLVAGQSLLATHFALAGDRVRVNVEVIDLASGQRAVVLPDAGMAQLVSGEMAGRKAGEHLLVASRSDLAGLVAVRFDPRSLRTLGDPVTVWNGGMVSAFDVSPTGTLAMATRPDESSLRRLAWIDANGQPQPIAGTSRAFAKIGVSPDGGRVATTVETMNPDDLNSEIWVQDLTRMTSTRIQVLGLIDGVLWSNDGQRIAYDSLTKDEFAIWERPAAAIGEAAKIFAIPAGQQSFLSLSAWSPDGKILAVDQIDIKADKSDVLMLEQEPGGTTWKATPYLDSPTDEHALRFSPDGKWVVFCSVESGRHELYVQRFTGPGSGARDAASGRVQISTSGHDGSAWWSPDGTEIRFVDGEKQVVSVEVKIEPEFSASVPKVLFSVKDLKTRSFSWAPDGRLMVILEGENDRVNRFDLVVNFLDEVRAKIEGAR